MAVAFEYNEEMCAFLKEMNTSPYQTPPVMNNRGSTNPGDGGYLITTGKETRCMMQMYANDGLCLATALEMYDLASGTTMNMSNNAITDTAMYASGLCEATTWEMSSGSANIFMQYADPADDKAIFQTKIEVSKPIGKYSAIGVF